MCSCSSTDSSREASRRLRSASSAILLLYCMILSRVSVTMCWTWAQVCRGSKKEQKWRRLHEEGYDINRAHARPIARPLSWGLDIVVDFYERNWSGSSSVSSRNGDIWSSGQSCTRVTGSEMWENQSRFFTLIHTSKSFLLRPGADGLIKDTTSILEQFHM